MTIRDIAVAIGFNVDDSALRNLGNTIRNTVSSAGRTVDNAAQGLGRAVRNTADAAGRSVQDSVRDSAENVQDTIGGVASFAKKALGGIAAAFAVSKLRSFAQECVALASDVQEMQGKFDAVFDGITEEVDEWATNFANSVGRNRNTIKRYLADQQNLLVGFANSYVESGEMTM